MERSQYELCVEVLRRLDRTGVLKHIVLVGSWCTLLYREYFSPHAYAPSLKTRDVDLLVPRPSVLDSRVDVADLLKDLGFVVGFTHVPQQALACPQKNALGTPQCGACLSAALRVKLPVSSWTAAEATQRSYYWS